MPNEISDSALTESRQSGETLFTGHVLRLERDTVTLPDGATATREVIRHPGAVCVVPLTDDGDVLLVRQYRYPHAEILREIPAGKLEPGEDPAAAAVRELAEETGARARMLTPMGVLYTSPAILDERIYMYVARGLTFGETHPDEDEFLAVERVPLPRLVADILASRVPDAKTQAAVLRVWCAENARPGV